MNFKALHQLTLYSKLIDLTFINIYLQGMVFDDSIINFLFYQNISQHYHLELNP
jgi:hypothetical protein